MAPPVISTSAITFLFNPSAEGVGNWYGGVFDPDFLRALSAADPIGLTRSVVLRGDALPSALAEKIVAVSSSDKTSGYTQSHDIDLYRMVHIFLMRVSVTEAKGQLTELVRRAEAGEEVVLMRHGHSAVRLVPIAAKPTPAEKAAVLEAVWKSVAKKKKSRGPSAARSQDFLYDENGLPK